jgi:hypothetical protein
MLSSSSGVELFLIAVPTIGPMMRERINQKPSSARTLIKIS